MTTRVVHNASAIRRIAILAAAGVAACLPAIADEKEPTFLQWFELRWSDMEYRMPDFFLAGYDAAWLPPISMTNSNQSPGYDPFDRFNVGVEGDETAYGTEADFKALVDEFHAADANVYTDHIMNHNGGRRTDAGFYQNGGWPGFWVNPSDPIVDLQPTDSWGDFHNSPNPFAYLQSENPSGPNYDLERGDLVALQDINQDSQNFFVRNPVDPADPQNIPTPAGATFNQPDPDNIRFYPDNDSAGTFVFNPGTFRNPGTRFITRYAFPEGSLGTDPSAGDEIPENASRYLMRATWWNMDVLGLDGFRLDAAKHISSSWWDLEWDMIVHKAWRHPSGEMVTPYSFGENVASNGFVYDTQIRRPNNNPRQGDEFGNRDALDINGSGSLRNILNAAGFASWDDALQQHIDNADGNNDGSLGVYHVFSHDNGTVGDGGSPPPMPTTRQMGLPQNAYALLRPGVSLIYHNARGITGGARFWPRQGVPLSLGREPVSNNPDSTITDLVQIAGDYARGDIDILNFSDPINQSLADVLVFARRQRGGGPGNLIVGVNDRYDPGHVTRNVVTHFAPGTRLHELTGNAANPDVDPGGVIPEVLVVDGAGRVSISIPNNVSSAGEHNRGYVAYGPALPSGTLSVSNVTGLLPRLPNFLPDYIRRINDIEIVVGETFDLSLTTTQTDPLDPNTDDNALFKFGRGYVDLNGNGSVDFPVGLSDDNGNGVLEYPDEQTVTGGYEQFLTVNNPLFGSEGNNGTYVQTIDASALDDGYHYIKVNAFRHRDDGGDPLFHQFRKVIYLDNESPGVEFIDPPATLDSTSTTIRVRTLDKTTNKVVGFLNPDPMDDLVALAQNATAGTQTDRFVWARDFTGIPEGQNTIAMVALEASGNGTVITHDFTVNLGGCPADVNNDGMASPADFTAWLSCFNDPGSAPFCDRADVNGSGTIDPADFTAWLAAFNDGCP